MFKKAILTISALALSAGMLVSASSDAEAKKYKSRYKKTQMVNFIDQIPYRKLKRLCRRYGCKGATPDPRPEPQNRSGYDKVKLRSDAGNIRYMDLKNEGGFYQIRNTGRTNWQALRGSVDGNEITIGDSTFIIIRRSRVTTARGRLRHRRYRVTRMSRRSLKRACLRKRRCRTAMYRTARKYTKRKARYIPTRYKRKLALKKRRALKRRRLLRKRRALRRSRYLPTRYKRKAAAKRRALKRRRILRKRRALKRSKYKRTSYRGRRHLRRRVR